MPTLPNDGALMLGLTFMPLPFDPAEDAAVSSLVLSALIFDCKLLGSKAVGADLLDKASICLCKPLGSNADTVGLFCNAVICA